MPYISFLRNYFFTGPSVADLGVTMALNLSTVCFGQVLAVTVTVLFWMLGFPLLSNLAFTYPVPPTGIGSFVQSGTVQQIGRAHVLTPVTVKSRMPSSA